jgi:hypothetical protein
MRDPCRGRPCRLPGPAVPGASLAVTRCRPTVLARRHPAGFHFKLSTLEHPSGACIRVFDTGNPLWNWVMWETYSIKSVSKIFRPIVELISVQLPVETWAKFRTVVFWFMTPCSLVYGYKYFWGTKGLHDYDKSWGCVSFLNVCIHISDYTAPKPRKE